MTNVHVKKLANVYRDKSVGKEYSFDDIVGAATITGDLSHRLKDTHWVTNGGTLRTYEKAMSMSLPDFGYVMARDTVYELSSGPTAVTAYEFSPCYTDNTLDVFDGDVTLDLHHNVDVFGISEDGNTMMVQTTVTPLNNTQYVDSYELWLIPTPDLVNVNGGISLMRTDIARACFCQNTLPSLRMRLLPRVQGQLRQLNPSSSSRFLI